MGDQKKMNALKQQIGKLEDDLQQLVEESSLKSGHSKAEIDLAVRDRGWQRFGSPLPEGYDPDGKLGALHDRIIKLEKELKDEEKKSD